MFLELDGKASEILKYRKMDPKINRPNFCDDKAAKTGQWTLIGCAYY